MRSYVSLRDKVSPWSTLVATFAALFSAAAVAAEPPMLAPDHAAKMAKGLEVFKSGVRTVLVARCVECHGGEETEAELDITTREALLKGGENGDAILPGKGSESLLVKLISHKQEPEMPAEAAKLKDNEIRAIIDWIDLGAPYDKPLIDKGEVHTPWTERKIAPEARDYWAFRSLAKVKPPAIENAKAAKNPIDQFVLQKLEAKGLTYNPQADRRHLIRRAYFDLTGLPPKPAEVEAFIKDNSPGAYSKVIDRLLASEQYGERWARHWLDLARFGESDGFEQDYDRKHAYHYRDFLIKALNQDMPYDQFVRWQIAGDEIAPHDPLAMMATGFLGAGVFPTQITEKEFERVRYDEMDDMLATTSLAVLGLSVGCARCHDHKFDPVPQADYYRMLETFTKTIRSEHAIELPAEGDLAAFEKRRVELASKRDAYEKKELPGRLTAWLKKQPVVANQTGSQGPWHAPQIVDVKSDGGAKMTILADQSILATGNNAKFDVYTLTLSTPAEKIASIRLEALTDKSMPRGGPGRARNGNFALTHFAISAEPLAGGKPQPVALKNPRATHQQNTTSLSVASALNPSGANGWAVDFGGIGKPQAAVFDFAKPLELPGGAKLSLTLKFENNAKHNLGHIRLSLADTPGLAPTVDGAAPTKPARPEALIATARDQGLDAIKPKDRAALISWYKQQDAGWQALDRVLAAHLNNRPRGKKITVMVSSEGVKPRKNHADGRGYKHFHNATYYLKRGDAGQKQGVVKQDFLQALMR
ncbi:MAG: DUF1549 domain-containing protein, partial [Pirellulales bacterium]|nr:DUF1549 domain-containing protein [Pirellulales bacterium]